MRMLAVGMRRTYFSWSTRIRRRSRAPGSYGASGSRQMPGPANSSTKWRAPASGERMTSFTAGIADLRVAKTGVRSRLAAAVPLGTASNSVLGASADRLPGPRLAVPLECLAQPLLQAVYGDPAEQRARLLAGEELELVAARRAG